MILRTALMSFAATLAIASAATPVAAQAADPAARLLPTITRTVLITADIQRLKRFYVDVFGFTPTFEGAVGGDRFGPTLAKAWHLAPGAKLYGVVLHSPRGDTELGLTSAQGQTLKSLVRPTGTAPMAGNHYLIIQVPNLDATLAKLAPYKPTYSRAPMKLADAEGKTTYEAAFFDPDGTLIIAVQDH